MAAIRLAADGCIGAERTAVSYLFVQFTSEEQFMYLRIAAQLLTSAVLAGAALAADPFVGEWKMNLSKSQFEGRPMPKSESVRFEPEPGGLLHTVERADAEGALTKTTYHYRLDGKEYPAAAGHGETVTRSRPDALHIEGTFRKDGKVVTEDCWAISPDGKTITRILSASANHPSGRPFNMKLIYEHK